MCVPMRGVFWNIRGLNKAGRINCLFDFIRNNNLDFIGIQETKKANISYACLKSINKDMTWEMLPANGTAGAFWWGLKTLFSI
jgi:exonuclease III